MSVEAPPKEKKTVIRNLFVYKISDRKHIYFNGVMWSVPVMIWKLISISSPPLVTEEMFNGYYGVSAHFLFLRSDFPSQHFSLNTYRVNAHDKGFWLCMNS